jgi:hypothetical protein
MPRKVKSSGVSTQSRRTSARRAMGATVAPEEGSGRRNQSSVADGGKWAGSGRKTVEKHEGPAIARQRQPGRGPKTRNAKRADKANHPNHG